MKPLTVTINIPPTVKSFKLFCQQLKAQNKLFHFEDNASDILNNNGEAIFTEDECLLLDDYLEIVFKTIHNPMSIALEVLNS